MFLLAREQMQALLTRHFSHLLIFHLHLLPQIMNLLLVEPSKIHCTPLFISSIFDNFLDVAILYIAEHVKLGFQCRRRFKFEILNSIILLIQIFECCGLAEI